MVLEISCIGGYNEIGKNMTAIRIDNEVYILDMGLHLENYIRLSEDEALIKHGIKELTEAGAIPDISQIKEWKSLVKAIIPTHAHLDHVGAIPFLANKFAAPIICTPFTGEVIKAILKDEKMTLKNEIKIINLNSSIKISETVTLEFISITHSTPHTCMIAIHTPYGVIVYANDFKFDMYPTLSQKPNIKRLKELGASGNVHSIIVDSTYAWDWRKMPSESVAQTMLRDVLLGTENKGNLIIVTTFSSHLARLKSIVEFGNKLGRKVIFLGRSLAKYIEAGENANLIDFNTEVVKYARKIRQKLKEIAKDRGKYLLVVTGHQGEPKSVLSRIIKGELEFKEGDQVIFSCTVIPTKTNLQNRRIMEQNLKEKKVRIFKDIHVSGHAGREDLRDLINLLKPKNIIPAHGEFTMTSALVDLGYEMGYKSKEIHLLQNGDRLKFE